MTAVVIVAKECVPGRVKTRLGRTIGMEAAADVAAASLQATMATVRSLPADRRVLLYDGSTPPPASDDFEVLPQTTGDLDVRLGAMFDAMTEPTLLVGMDTPQFSRDLVDEVFGAGAAREPEVDAWFGPASDGGFWALAMREPDGALVRGVPMSRTDTGEQQLAALLRRRLRVGMLPELTDVDELDDALAVAAAIPGSAFDRSLRAALRSRRTLQPASARLGSMEAAR